MKQRRSNATLKQALPPIADLALTILLILTALPLAGTAAPCLERQPLESLNTLNSTEATESDAPLSVFSATSAASVVQSSGVTTRVPVALRSSPVMFIGNVGQFDERARFQVRGGRGAIWLTEDAIWITIVEQLRVDTLERFDTAHVNVEHEDQPLQGVNLRLTFPGANPHPRIEPFDRLDTAVSYFIGSDSDQWRPDVPVWGAVRYVDLYPGVDLEMTGASGNWTWRLVFHNPKSEIHIPEVRLRVDGADTLTLDGHYLRLTTAVGDFTLPLLTVEGLNVECANVERTNEQTFEVSSPFSSTPLFPRSPAPLQDNPADLLYATFLGGSNYQDWGHDIAIDSSGAAYVTGKTYSFDFPATPGAFDTSLDDHGDAFVAKLNPTGSALDYATFLGGGGGDAGSGIAVDSGGAAYVMGYTGSSDFPTTPVAFDTSFNGGDFFVAKLNPTGSALVYATFLGGGASDGCDGYLGRCGDYGIAVDLSGAAYVTGGTYSSGFPTTPGAFDTSFNGGDWDTFIAKLNSTGSTLVYATFLGGGGSERGMGIALDSSGAAYVTGATGSSDFPTTPGAFDTSYHGIDCDAFIVKLNPTGSGLVYGTFLGGGRGDNGYDITVDGNEAAYVTGMAWSSDFPTTPGAFDTSHSGGYCDAFVVKVNPTGSALDYGTFLGERNYVDEGFGIAIDGSGTAYVTGRASSGFPTTPDAFDTTYNGGYSDAFVAKLTPTGSALLYATFLGGGDWDEGSSIAIDGNGAAYVTGRTYSFDFPTTPGAFDTSHNGSPSGYDGFVAKLAVGGGPDKFADLGNPEDEAQHNLIGWGTAGGPPGGPYPPPPSGDTTKRYQALRADNSLDLGVEQVNVSHLLTTEVEDGGCTDNFEIYVNGEGPIYHYTGRNTGTSNITAEVHRIVVPAEYITQPRVTVTFRNTSTDDCGLAAVYNVALTPSIDVPEVTTLPASEPTLTSATLNGIVNPNGSDTSAWFEWGTEPNLPTSSSTPEETIGAGTEPVEVTATLTGLELGKTYYYRIVARNQAGTSGRTIENIKNLAILLGRYPNTYDRVIYSYAVASGIPAPLLKALFVQESSLNEKNFRYEPKVDVRTKFEEKYRNSWLPDAYPPRIYPKSIQVPAKITIRRFWEVYHNVIPMSPPIDLTDEQRNQQAQWRVASSYGLGQILYPSHADKIGWAEPETFYDPYINTRSAVQHLVWLRDTSGRGKTKCDRDFDDFSLDGFSKAILAYNMGHGICGCSNLDCVRRLRPQEHWWCGNVPCHLQRIKIYVSQTQPIVVPNADTSGILPPLSSFKIAVGLAPLMFPAPGEYEMDRLVADLKGTGQPQLAVLYTVVDPEVGPTEGVLKVFTDVAGSALEWQSPPMPGVLPAGTVYTQTLSAGGPPVLAASWGVGAHGTVLFLFRWDGQTFRAVPVIEAGGEEVYSLFGDAGVLVTETGLVVDDRDADEPLNVTIVTHYAWNEETEAFSYEDQQIIRNIPYQVYLPLILKNYPPDTTPPATVTNLATSNPTLNSITLNWTAPGDDGHTGTASQYDIRYSTSPITGANWDAAAQCVGEPAPQPAGSSETFTVHGLAPNTTYYFALKTADEVPNWSGLSNVASGATQRPSDQLIINCGFETDEGWVFGETPRPAAYTTEDVHWGARSVRLGIKPPTTDAYSWSSVRQRITIPAHAASATLSFWYKPFTECTCQDNWQQFDWSDYSVDQPGRIPPDRHLSSWASCDWQQALVLADDFPNPTILATVMNISSNSGVWTHQTFDFTPFAGQTVWVYFNVYNDGWGYRRTWMYLDDASVMVYY